MSPNLPADIEDELLKLTESKENPTQQSSTSDIASFPSKKASSDQITQTEKPKSAKSSEKNTTTTAKTSERTVAKHSQRETKGLKSLTPNDLKAVAANGVTKAHSTPSENASITENQKVTHVTPGAVRSKSEQQRSSLILKLRIPKAIRKNCARILNMKPRQHKNVDQFGKKYLSNKIPGDEPDPKIKEGLALASKSAEKRRRPEDDAGAIVEPANKRSKHPDHLDLSTKPRTPSKPPVLSPELSQHGSAQKSHLSTPLEVLRGPAMRRIGSSEGDVTTPLGATRGSTPVASIASDRISREGRSTSSASSNDVSNRDRINLLKNDQSKFATLGRKLKHEAQDLIRTESEWKIDGPDTKQGAALAFEALLAFMLSFALKDEISHAHGLPSDVTAWRSIIGYIPLVKMATQLYPPLRGLVHQLEAVCRDAIAIHDTYRLETDAFLKTLQDDVRASAATSNGAGSPSVEEKAKSKKDFFEFRTEYARNLREIQQAWQIGYSKLSVRELQRTFPNSWARSIETPGLGKTRDEITCGHYLEAGYYLPLGPTTACSEAVRAGWSMLKEWCSKRGVKWEAKLDL